MIPVNQNTPSDSTPTDHTTLLTPVAATEQRAESQMKEEAKLGKPRIKVVKSIKKRNWVKSSI